MPFKSKKQMRWAFATDQPWADEWAEHTNMSALKEHVEKKKSERRKKKKKK